jgi:hypothetical protein
VRSSCLRPDARMEPGREHVDEYLVGTGRDRDRELLIPGS